MNLNDLLKEHLYANGERIVVSASYAEFQLIFSCFHNYEVSVYIVYYVCICISIL